MTSTRAPGRPLDATIDADLLRVTADLLVEQGYERLAMDEVARRSGTSKTTIYRRWPGKAALTIAAARALFTPPPVPDTGDLREDLLGCARAYIQDGGRSAQVMAAVMTASRHDRALRDLATTELGEPYGSAFATVLARAVQRGEVLPSVDIAVLAEMFPAFAYQRTAARGLLVTEDDVVRVIDAVLLPALHLHR